MNLRPSPTANPNNDAHSAHWNSGLMTSAGVLRRGSAGFMLAPLGQSLLGLRKAVKPAGSTRSYPRMPLDYRKASEKGQPRVCGADEGRFTGPGIQRLEAA